MKRLTILLTALIVLATPLLSTAAASAQSTSAQPTRKIYVALGDSVAAGLGLPSVANPTATDTLCGRSSQAYATTVAKTANLPLVNAACSGATAGDLFTKQAVAGPNIQSQLKTAYAAGMPQLLTITAGANDIQWANFIRACYALNCANDSYTTAVKAYELLLRAKLYIAFTDIAVRGGNNPPTTVITGYYDPLSANCASIQNNITPAELSWIRTTTDSLNQTIADVASHYSFVKYAPVDFTGHDICSANSWVQGPTAAAPFHPTAAGQKAIAAAIITKLRN